MASVGMQGVSDTPVEPTAPSRQGDPSKVGTSSPGGINLLSFVAASAQYALARAPAGTLLQENQSQAAQKYHALVIKRMDAEQRLHYRYEV
jgi:hypothetical protein